MRYLVVAVFLFFSLHTTSFADDFGSGMSAYQSKDYTKAVKQWLLSAKKGHSLAQANLALMYDNGLGGEDEINSSYFRKG